MASSSESVSSAEKMKTDFCEPKRYTGVRLRNSGRWQATVRNSFKKKSSIHLGTFDTPEEASMAFIAKKLEFKLLKAAASSNESSQPSLLKTESSKVVKKTVPTKCLLLVQSNTGYGDKDGTKYPEEIERVLGQTPAIKRYKGVWRRKSGMWVSKIRDPLKNVRVWVGVFETDEEACNAYYFKKLELEAQITTVTATVKPESQPIVANESHSQQESLNSAIAIEDLDLPNGTSSTMNCNPMEASDEKVVVVDEGLFLGQFLPALIIDNHGFLLGEFSCVDDLRICKD